MSRAPKILTTFKSKDIKSDKITEYHIQYLTEDQYEEAVKLYLENYLVDEPLATTRKMQEKEDCRKEMCELWLMTMQEGISLGCFKNVENGSELIGANLLCVKSKDNPDDYSKIRNKDIKDMIDIMIYAYDKYNPYAEHGIEKFLGSFCLTVNRAYRGRGIAKELLRARKFVMEELDLSVTSSVFSAPGSQGAAKSVGYKEVFSIRYEDLREIDPNFDFVNPLSKYYKIQEWKI